MKILLVLGSGGHTAQMLRLVEELGNKFEYTYLISIGDSLSKEKIKTNGEVVYAHRARNHGDNVLVTFFKVIRLFWESLLILNKTKPSAVVSAGPGIAVPISILAKLLRKKVIYIEDSSRVCTKSTSGSIIYRFADLFFVQWPEARRIYPEAVFAGRL